MMVVAIIILLLGAAVYKMKGSIEAAKIVRAHSDLKTFQTSLVTYESLAGTLPSTAQGLKALVEKPTSEPKPRIWNRVLDSLQKDPWNHDYIYEYPGKRSPGSYDVSSAGPDGVPNTEDDIGNWQQL